MICFCSMKDMTSPKCTSFSGSSKTVMVPPSSGWYNRPTSLSRVLLPQPERP